MTILGCQFLTMLEKYGYGESHRVQLLRFCHGSRMKWHFIWLGSHVRQSRPVLNCNCPDRKERTRWHFWTFSKNPGQNNTTEIAGSIPKRLVYRKIRNFLLFCFTQQFIANKKDPPTRTVRWFVWIGTGAKPTFF